MFCPSPTLSKPPVFTYQNDLTVVACDRTSEAFKLWWEANKNNLPYNLLIVGPWVDKECTLQLSKKAIEYGILMHDIFSRAQNSFKQPSSLGGVLAILGDA